MTTSEQHQLAASAGCGLRLRNAREKAGLRLEDVAARLKMPVRVVQALENDDWDRAGAAVFVRGQLRSYAKLLGINIDDAIEMAGVRRIEPSEIVSHVHTPPLQRLFEQTARRLVYVVMTAVIVVPVWMMATRGPLGTPSQDNTARLDAPVTPQAAPASTRSPAPVTVRERAPMVASLTPPLPAQPPASALKLRLNGDSWMEIEAPDGRVIEKGLLPAGTERSYARGEVARLVIGNASAVEVQQAGQVVDTGPFRRANVARFTVSSDGSIAPE
ncbi:cytoskeleton protein RodZ [Luteimonas cucumeris]|uniref:Cytoskeleton protein RodZ n=1 Tax=Luteimonas cucumeris TaxID=985012 RepID=A0A562L8B6_9GAMM|nr:RodZ domain-containing protein [Luteimonas cucumeris]TWI03873.1 cytoskeleton protein RodZ [Luteimonas cucumeris]